MQVIFPLDIILLNALDKVKPRDIDKWYVNTKNSNSIETDRRIYVIRATCESKVLFIKLQISMRDQKQQKILIWLPLFLNHFYITNWSS